MKRTAVVVLCGALAGCSFVFQELKAPGFNEKLVGLDKAQVIETLGSPQEKKSVIIDGDSYEVWNYEVRKTGKVNKVGYTYYQVVFEGDTVKRWEKVRVYAQPSFEYNEPQPPAGHVATMHFQPSQAE